MQQVPEYYKHTSTSNVLSNILHGESPTSVHKMCVKQTGAAYTDIILTMCDALVMQETQASAFLLHQTMLQAPSGPVF